MSGERETPVRLGLVGLGMAGGIMALSARQHPGMAIVAAADRSPLLRERFAADSVARVYDDLAALLADPNVEAVYIATPHQFHCEHAVLALNQGKHVVVEKPMALTLAECDVMIAAAERNDRLLIVGHTHSFDPAITTMARVIKGGEIGPVAMIGMWDYTNFLYRPRRPEELDTSKGGGILFNQLPHQIDVARFLVGRPVESVRASTFILDPARPTEGACTAFLGFEGGAAVNLTYSGYDRFDSDELHGWINELGHVGQPAHGATRRALAALASDGSEAEARTARYGYGASMFAGEAPAQPHFGAMVVTCQRGDMRQSANGVLIYDDAGVREIEIKQTPWRAGFGDVLDELHAALRRGLVPAHTGSFARGTVEACLAVQQSARQNSEVRLGPT